LTQVGEAALAVGLQAPGHELPNTWWRLRGPGGPIWASFDRPCNALDLVRPAERGTSGDAFEENASERKDVRAVIVRFATNLLGAHVARRACEPPCVHAVQGFVRRGGGWSVRFLEARDPARQPKVEDLHDSVGIQHGVPWLEIPVHHATRMGLH